ncbi:MAG: BREX-1 system phosphatase PglZ type B [Ardenticatenia bacterium]|nr:BREX-1 system phosphatase PglZ type B [Ardenticatenia bacterium]
MSNRETFLDALATALATAGHYNRNDQVGPAAALWPDEQRQWEPLLPLLRARLPVLTLGEYDPAQRTGPSYWLRCMIGRTIFEDVIPENQVPIIYLPGYGKQHLRAIEECPKALQPLAELQYRGALWLHPNGRDWRVTGFLYSLDIPVGSDNETREALARALPRLAHEPLARLLKQAPLYAPFFNELLHPDAVRQMLLWLSDPQVFRDQLREDEWAAFRAICRQKYEVDPVTDGAITVAKHLAEKEGDWAAVWQRYVEAPEAYPGIPELLTRAQPSQLPLILGEPSPVWPQYNRTAEERLQEALRGLRDRLPEQVRAALLALEEEHGERRNWVWAKLDQAPLASALAHLVSLARLTEKPISGADVAGIAGNYVAWGWQADAAVLDALAAVQHDRDVTAVKSAILPLYRGWLSESAEKMQQAVLQDPQQNYVPGMPPAGGPGTCIVFCDALRYDLGQRLVAQLEVRGLECEVAWRLAALPTVTATAKPATSPAADQIKGSDEPGLTPVARKTGTGINATSLRNLIEAAGWQILQSDEAGDPTGQGWTEIGAIDAYGHQHGWRVAQHARGEVVSLADRVESLLQHGWKRIVVVTDHGWLMLPDGLPKAELAIHLTELRKGRCAVLKPGAQTDQQVVPWHWNPEVCIAVARDIRCYEAGKEYEHGGISPQECVLPVITVTVGESAEAAVTIQEVTWRGLRCYVQLDGASSDMAVDIRSKAGDAGTSLALESKLPEADGSVSLLVPDEDNEGEAAFVVVVSMSGELKAQQLTIVGGE